MRGVSQPPPPEGSPPSARGGPARRSTPPAGRQLSFGFDGGATPATGAGAARPVVQGVGAALVGLAPAASGRSSTASAPASSPGAQIAAPPSVLRPDGAIASPSPVAIAGSSIARVGPLVSGAPTVLPLGATAPSAVIAPPRAPLPSFLPAAAVPVLRESAAPALVAPMRPPARDEEAARVEIEQVMRSMLGVRVEVELTSNRRTMISSARTGTALRLRLHRMFVEADHAIVDALGRYVKTGDRRASRRLGEFIEAQRSRFITPRAPRTLRARGEHHDLDALFAKIEATEFPGAVHGVTITWGRHGAAARGRRRKRSIRLGTYTHDERLIRVHPVLDQSWVPAFFVEYIVFHEMLHHVEPAREEDGRTLFHTPEFRRRERAYHGYERALAWERANISKLLTS